VAAGEALAAVWRGESPIERTLTMLVGALREALNARRVSYYHSLDGERVGAVITTESDPATRERLIGRIGPPAPHCRLAGLEADARALARWGRHRRPAFLAGVRE